MTAHLSLALFSAAEVERITGAAPSLQRVWRARGFLPPVQTRGRFNAFEVAEIWAMKLFSERGIGPEFSTNVAATCGAAIVWQALKWSDAYNCDQRYYSKHRDGMQRSLYFKLGVPLEARTEFFFWWADGTHSWDSSLKNAFGGSHGAPRYHGPIIVLDMAALGDALLERAGQPLVQVEGNTPPISVVREHA